MTELDSNPIFSEMFNEQAVQPVQQAQVGNVFNNAAVPLNPQMAMNDPGATHTGKIQAPNTLLDDMHLTSHDLCEVMPQQSPIIELCGGLAKEVSVAKQMITPQEPQVAQVVDPNAVVPNTQWTREAQISDPSPNGMMP